MSYLDERQPVLHITVNYLCDSKPIRLSQDDSRSYVIDSSQSQSEGLKSIRALVAIAMAQVAHPNGDGTIEVEVIDEETHGDEYVQIQAVEDGVSLTDQSDNPPWVKAEKLQ